MIWADITNLRVTATKSTMPDSRCPKGDVTAVFEALLRFEGGAMTVAFPGSWHVAGMAFPPTGSIESAMRRLSRRRRTPELKLLFANTARLDAPHNRVLERKRA